LLRLEAISLDFKELETFVCIIEKGSISAAAASLGLSQPAVSKRVARLEEEVNAALFINSHKHSTLTSEGSILYKTALKILDMRKKAHLQIAELSQEVNGLVRISASSIPGDFILPGLLVEFSQAHPGVNIQLTQGDSKAAVEDLIAKRADLAVIGSEKTTIPGFTTLPFFHDELVLIVSRSHPLASKQYVTVEEAASLNLIGRTSGSGSQQVWERVCKSRTGAVKECELQFGHTMGVVNAVAAGAEAGVISMYAAHSSPLVTALHFRPALHRTFHLAYGICESKAIEVLLSFLTQKAEEKRGAL